MDRFHFNNCSARILATRALFTYQQPRKIFAYWPKIFHLKVLVVFSTIECVFLYSTSHHSSLIIPVHQMKYLDLASVPPHLLQLRTKKMHVYSGAVVVITSVSFSPVQAMHAR